MSRRKVVLYNPRSLFWTMPLALIAVGSALDASRYSVILVDGRLEADPVAALLKHLDDGAVCLGVTVLTGAPIRDALSVSRAIKRLRPDIPIVWGGWHPSIFPQQCLSEPSVDAVVIGQGEITFSEMVERLAQGGTLDGIAGCASHSSAPDPPLSPSRPLIDIDRLPEHNYAFAQVEDYFRRKGKRQFDYVSSQGCRFRCAFCADPAVYNRGWYGLDPERIARELVSHRGTYRFNEVAFQDETFFTSPARVEAIALAFLKHDLNLEWTATMRSDQGSRLDDRVLSLCRRSGLKRVMIGVESGSPQMLRRIRKDISLDQVFNSAEKCARAGVGAILNFIVGFPEESDEQIHQTLDLAANLLELSPDFEASFFYFRPYPGTELAEALSKRGYKFGENLEDWADFDYIGGKEAWVTDAQWQQIERFKFYQRHAFGNRRPLLRRPLQILSRWRIERRFYGFPLEKIVLERLKPAQKLS